MLCLDIWNAATYAGVLFIESENSAGKILSSIECFVMSVSKFDKALFLSWTYAILMDTVDMFQI